MPAFLKNVDRLKAGIQIARQLQDKKIQHNLDLIEYYIKKGSQAHWSNPYNYYLRELASRLRRWNPSPEKIQNYNILKSKLEKKLSALYDALKLDLERQKTPYWSHRSYDFNKSDYKLNISLRNSLERALFTKKNLSSVEMLAINWIINDDETLITKNEFKIVNKLYLHFLYMRRRSNNVIYDVIDFMQFRGGPLYKKDYELFKSFFKQEFDQITKFAKVKPGDILFCKDENQNSNVVLACSYIEYDCNALSYSLKVMNNEKYESVPLKFLRLRR
jgi:hypothetical protein